MENLLPDGFMRVRRSNGSPLEIQCLHPGCHHATHIGAPGDRIEKNFIEKHKHGRDL